MLASWNDGATRAAILGYRERVTVDGGPDHVPPAERIAVVDNDGTLWCEKPAVNHDDAEREYSYGGEALTNPDAEPILTTAEHFGWTVVSMRDDWSRVFA
jgi:hypothetical protein